MKLDPSKKSAYIEAVREVASESQQMPGLTANEKAQIADSAECIEAATSDLFDVLSRYEWKDVINALGQILLADASIEPHNCERWHEVSDGFDKLESLHSMLAAKHISQHAEKYLAEGRTAEAAEAIKNMVELINSTSLGREADRRVNKDAPFMSPHVGQA